MGELWNPDAERNAAPRYLWGPVQDPEVGVLHSTESRGRFRPAASSYFGHTSYPNCTVSRGVPFEHMPANVSSRALKNLPGGVQTNRRGTYQIEIDWNAADIANCPADTMAAVRAQMAWVSSVTSIPLECSVTFHPYPVTTPGVRYGREPWRLSFAEWLAYEGWLGHQHVPENEHGDPGAIDIAYLLGGAPNPKEWDEMATQQEVQAASKAGALEALREHKVATESHVDDRALKVVIAITGSQIPDLSKKATNLGDLVNLQNATIATVNSKADGTVDVDRLADQLRSGLGDEIADELGRRLAG